MKKIQVTGKTVDAAVEEGLKQLGITRAEAVVRVIEQPQSGLFGLIHKKDALVEIAAPELEEAPDLTAPAEMKSTPAPEVKPEVKEEIKTEEAPQAEEVKAEEKPEEPAPETAAAEPETEADETVAEEKPKKEELPFNEEEQAVAAEDAKKFLEGVFEGMGLDVQMEKMMNEERILYTLHGEGLGILIGKHGQTLDALQYLTNLAAGKNVRRHYFVMLDVGNSRSRRKKTLEALAKRLATKVKNSGVETKLEPMSAGERRVIHLALVNDPGVITESEGEAPYRSVVIKPRQ